MKKEKEKNEKTFFHLQFHELIELNIYLSLIHRLMQ